MVGARWGSFLWGIGVGRGASGGGGVMVPLFTRGCLGSWGRGWEGIIGGGGRGGGVTCSFGERTRPLILRLAATERNSGRSVLATWTSP